MGIIQHSDVDRESVRRLSQPKLDRLGFVWEDVEGIIPVTFPTMKMFLKDLPNPNTMIFTYSLGDLARLENAVKGALQSWQLLRSIAVDTGEGPPMLLVLRYNDRYLKKAVVHWPAVSNEQQLENSGAKSDHWKGEVPRGLLCTTAVGRITDTRACALAITLNHAVIDGVALRMFYGDIATLLIGGTLSEKVEWPLFSNTYRFYGTSIPAQEAIASNLKRLQGLGAFQASVWPRVDGTTAESRTTKACSARSLEAVEVRDHAIIHYAQERHLPNLQTCLQDLDVRPAIVTKAAIALFNCRMSGTMTALIAVVLSGRSWPFLDESVARFLPNPKHIAGPTISMCTDVIKLGPEETVVQMLKRLDQEQRCITRYQHCPLSILGHLNDEDRSVWARARKQIFNWFPFSQTRSIGRVDGKPMLELVSDKASKVDEQVDEFTWRGEMLDEERLKIEVYANPTAFDMTALQGIVEQVLDIFEALLDDRNRDQEIGKVVSFGQKPAER